MSVTDDHVAALRAHLALDPDKFERLNAQIFQAGDVAGYGKLVHAAFVSAARRRFAPAWTVSDVIGFVVAARLRLREIEIDIDPRASEVLIRQALGEETATDPDKEAGGRAQIFLLSELVFDENLDGAALDEFLVSARRLAESGVEH